MKEEQHRHVTEVVCLGHQHHRQWDQHLTLTVQVPTRPSAHPPPTHLYVRTQDRTCKIL